METLATYIDVTKPSLWLAAGTIVFNPTFWNIMGTSEHKYR